MKLYLAASYTRKPLILEYAKALQAEGFETTSRWLTEPEHPETWLEELTPEQLDQYAFRDLEDIEKADIFLLFTEALPDETKRAGRHVEFGYALAHMKSVIVIGPRINIFHYLYGVHQYDTLEKWIKADKECQIREVELGKIFKALPLKEGERTTPAS